MIQPILITLVIVALVIVALVVGVMYIIWRYEADAQMQADERLMPRGRKR